MAALLKSLPFLTLLTHLLSPMVLAFCSACYSFTSPPCSWVVCREYDGYHSECVNGKSSYYKYLPQEEWVFGRCNWISSIAALLNRFETIEILHKFIFNTFENNTTDLKLRFFSCVEHNNIKSSPIMPQQQWDYTHAFLSCELNTSCQLSALPDILIRLSCCSATSS